MSPDELDEYVPEISPSDVDVAAIEHEAGFADPHLVTSAFAARAAELGADVRTNTPVVDLVVENGTVTEIVTDDERVPVDVVVDSAGPRAREVAAMAGVDLPLTRYEAKVVTLAAESEFTPASPTVSDVGLGLYAKPEATGHIIAGGIGREAGRDPIRDRSHLEGATTGNLRRLGEMIDTRLLGFGDAEVVETWSDVITAPPDWHQLVGVPSGVENLFVAAGGSGHGFKEAPGFAESIAQLLLDRSPTIDLTPYRPDRFEEGDRFAGGYGDGSRA